MSPFYERFPEVAVAETRTAFIGPGPGGPPAGEYGFIELYCDEAGCDCRRVLLCVLNPATGDKVWATINYGWETRAHYRKWSAAPDLDENIDRASLDPICPQSEHASFFLELFEQSVADRAYVERLKRHYRMFKDAVEHDARAGGLGGEHSAGGSEKGP